MSSKELNEIISIYRSMNDDFETPSSNDETFDHLSPEELECLYVTSHHELEIKTTKFMNLVSDMKKTVEQAKMEFYEASMERLFHEHDRVVFGKHRTFQHTVELNFAKEKEKKQKMLYANSSDVCKLLERKMKHHIYNLQRKIINIRAKHNQNKN